MSKSPSEYKNPAEHFPNAKWYHPKDLVRRIEPRDSVTILVPNGMGRNGQEWKEKTGKAVICNNGRGIDPAGGYKPNVRPVKFPTVALNMGGPHGTPGLATPNNIVCIGKNERAMHTSCTGEPWKKE